MGRAGRSLRSSSTARAPCGSGPHPQLAGPSRAGESYSHQVQLQSPNLLGSSVEETMILNRSGLIGGCFV